MDIIMEPIKPIHRPKEKDELPRPDLNSDYCKMVEALWKNPQEIIYYNGLLCEILDPLSNSQGTLSISKGDNQICFLHKGKPFTDFGAIPLTTVLLHYIDHIEYVFELLILSRDTPSKLVRVESKRLGSGWWIEELGPRYIYQSQKMWNLKILIQCMGKYAPVMDEFLFSGWMPDNSSIYIMDGHRLCGNEWKANNSDVSCNHTLQMLDVAPHRLTIPLLSHCNLIFDTQQNGGEWDVFQRDMLHCGTLSIVQNYISLIIFRFSKWV